MRSVCRGLSLLFFVLAPTIVEAASRSGAGRALALFGHGKGWRG